MKVDPANVWLRDGVDGTAYFPEQDGTLNLDAIDRFTSLEVEGGRSKFHICSCRIATRPMFKSVTAWWFGLRKCL